MAEEKQKKSVLEKALKRIEENFGKGSIMILGDETQVQPVEVIPTGSIAIDIATGVGGYPRGRIVEIFGPESSGKTTLALHAIAEAQKVGGGLRRCAGSESGNRRSHGRHAGGSSSAPHVTGVEKDRGKREQVEGGRDIHEPDKDEDRRHVWESGNNNRWPCLEVLRDHET